MKNTIESLARTGIIAIVFLCFSVPKLAPAQGQTVTHPDGTVTTTESSKEYGEGGTEETTSDKEYRVIKKIYRDKCGRIKQIYQAPKGETAFDVYIFPDRSRITVDHKRKGDDYYDGGNYPMDKDKGKETIDYLRKLPIAPCPEKAQKTTDHPEKPKENPNPLGKILRNVSIGVGVSGGRTVGHSGHGKDRHLNDRRSAKTSSSHKAVTSGCKCHPCTCSPCRCH